MAEKGDGGLKAITDLAQLSNDLAVDVPQSDQNQDSNLVVPYQEPPQEHFDRAKEELLRRVIIEREKRKRESLKMYRPLHGDVINFHKSTANERLVRGSNRAGKTLAAAVEVARAVTGQDPYNKYPKKNGRFILVGLSEEHCGSVMYRKLFMPGAFRLIRFKKRWRACKNWREVESPRSKEAPPLIPPRMVKHISWVEKKRGIPRRVTLHNGWELTFFSSKADPPQGWDIDGWWIDEECQNEDWYPELSARTMDRRGSGFWSATPQVANQQLYDMHLRSEAAKDEGVSKPPVTEHVMLLKDNPCISPKEIDLLKEKLNEEEQRVRIGGEFAITSFKVYPEYDKGLHCLPEGWRVPDEWAHFLSVDPGRQICGVLFAAIPPPREAIKHPYIAIYDELYLKDCTADMFASSVARKAPGVVFDSMLIDWHAARVSETGSGMTIGMQYSNALKRHRVTSRQGTSFIPGPHDVKAGIEKVHEWMRRRPGDMGAYLRVVRMACPKFEWEIGRYHYKRIKFIPTDEPEQKNNHLMDSLRYLAMFGPRWRKPKKVASVRSGAVRAMEAKRKKKNAREDRPGIQLGPKRRRKAGVGA